MIYHILNGDALKDKFPKDLSGEIIVARECLVDGNVEGESLEDLFNTRARFISESYSVYDDEGYFVKVAPEFEKIRNIPSSSEVNLWFEDDLFCQVNLWFVIHLLNETDSRNINLNLVRPTTDLQYGFGGMSSLDLLSAYQHKIEIDQPTLDVLRKLWKLYQNKNHHAMIKLVDELVPQFGFVKIAVQAEINRCPNDETYGRPTQALIDIMTELNTDDFGTVFREFSRREAIYGFGDLQVKRLLAEIKKNS